MGTPVSTTSTPSKSRRALLAGALGGLGAWAATAVGRASPVHAEGENIVVGGEYSTATTLTRLSNQANSNPVFKADSLESGTGVEGRSVDGIGVAGGSGGGTGVWGGSIGSTGVHGATVSGVGVRCTANTGLALQTVGRLQLGTSGVATIPAGSASKTVTPGVLVSPASFVLLTPKVNLGSRALWFTTNPTADRFTIRMSAPRSSGTKVAWLLLG